jgi:hypothetical protein
MTRDHLIADHPGRAGLPRARRQQVIEIQRQHGRHARNVGPQCFAGD